MTTIKNMAYWKVKNGIITPAKIPGINNNSEGNTDLPNGLSKSSALQAKEEKPTYKKGKTPTTPSKPPKPPKMKTLHEKQ